MKTECRVWASSEKEKCLLLTRKDFLLRLHNLKDPDPLINIGRQRRVGDSLLTVLKDGGSLW